MEGDEKSEKQETTTTDLGLNCFIRWQSQIITRADSDALFKELMAEIPWRETLKPTRRGAAAAEGEPAKLPRLQFWMADHQFVKAQLFQKGDPFLWTPSMTKLKETLEDLLDASFDYCLMNLYRDGNDSIGFHRDDEAFEPGKNVIASVSLGATRTFIIKPHKKGKNDKTQERAFQLVHGSLITMEGDTQLHWVHSVPAQPEIKEPRINLTFRHS